MKFGNIELNWLGHSGFLINNHGKNIYIDPYNLSKSEPKADVILITHSHYDHCSIVDIEKIAHAGTIVILPPDCQSKITKLENVEMQIMIPGDEITVTGIKVQAVPAYNKSSEFHTKSEEWNGYVLKFDKVIIYHAGDTDFIDEMQKLSGYGKQGNEFIALFPVGGNVTMNSSEAANAAGMLKPMLAIPMHYGAIVGGKADAEMFVKLCREKGVRAEMLEKI